MNLPNGKIKRVTPLITLLFTSILVVTLHADAQTDENWYQVELLIFKRAPSPNENEAWPKNLALAYPPNVQSLIEQKEKSQDTASDTTPANTPVDPSGRITNSSNTDENSEEKPYVVFESNRFFIENATSAIKRERGLHLLFHKTWAQPMQSQESAPAIIILGGETFGDLHELSGTITLSLSRYLHLHTDLWLTEYEANYGQESYHWPRIPLPPKPLEAEDLTADSTLVNPSGFQLNNSQSSGDFNLNFNATSPAGNSALDNEWSSLTSRPFLVKHITTLNQKRRMRSNELHYIDHPRMGILIKIIPYTPAHLQPIEEQ